MLCWVHLSERLCVGSDECQASKRLYEKTLLHRPVQWQRTGKLLQKYFNGKYPFKKKFLSFARGIEKPQGFQIITKNYMKFITATGILSSRRSLNSLKHCVRPSATVIHCHIQTNIFHPISNCHK